jgi:putative holliday junction resolvase
MTVSAKDNGIQGPILALDLGEKRVGVALSDELLITIKRLEPLTRTNWKQLLSDVRSLALRFDAKTLVIGLPLSLNGEPGTAVDVVRQTAEKFAKSLDLPVFLEDERLTSVEAAERLREEGISANELKSLIDSESAAIILRDFIASDQKRTQVKPISNP